MEKRNDAVENLIEDWYFDEKTYRYAKALGSVVQRFVASLEKQFSESTVHKHLDNCKHLGFLECRNTSRVRFSAQRFFLSEEAPHEDLFIEKVSRSRYALDAYKATWKRLRQFALAESSAFASPPAPVPAVKRTRAGRLNVRKPKPDRVAAPRSTAKSRQERSTPSGLTRRISLPTGTDQHTVEQAEQYLVERFRHNVQIRTLDEEARARLGSRYKKGYEVRLLAGDDDDLQLIRSLIQRVGLKVARPFKKRDRWVQPLYGKQAVDWFLERRQ
ncbi:MAG: hypothetical protein RBU37_02930 [Myxococcota bacterium]|jgi:hypothetical protein|nr:hypothetical protein [Myxococcota bacterium]